MAADDSFVSFSTAESPSSVASDYSLADELFQLQVDDSFDLSTAASNSPSNLDKFRLRCVVHNIPDKVADSHDGDVERAVRVLFEPHVQVISCQKQGGHGKSSFQGQSVEVSVIPNPDMKPTVKSKHAFAEWLRIRWCTRIIQSNDMYRCLWLDAAHPPPSENYRNNPIHTMKVRQISLGTFVSSGIFNCHWKSPSYTVTTTVHTSPKAVQDEMQNEDRHDDGHDDDDDEEDDEDCNEATDIGLSASVDHDNGLMRIHWVESHESQWRLDFKLEDLADRVVLVNRSGMEMHMYLFLYHQPKIFHGVPRMSLTSFDVDYTAGATVWMRDVHLGTAESSCSRDTFGHCNVVHLFTPIEDNATNLLHRLERDDFVVYYCNPEVAPTRVQRQPRCPKFKTFEATYVWYCLVSHGFRVTDQLTPELLKFVESKKDHSNIEQILLAVSRRIDECISFDLKQTILDELKLDEQRNQSSARMELDNENHVKNVRRVVLTPTTIRGLPAEAVVGNRVVREFGADRFIRVVIRDEDLEQLSAAGCGINQPVKVITEFLNRDLEIGDRRYHFLGCSNSQLREHGFWMYASDGKKEHTVDEIRQWMGDLSGERCVASYVSRLGQFFTSARNTITVENTVHIADVINDKYCFTDGIGKISPALAKKVSKKLEMQHIPAAYQIRFGGCKGVLALSPDLDGEQIHVRDSMEKFSSEHKELEVIRTTTPARLHLNRQIIVLMSGLGVTNEAFFSLQESMLQRLSGMMIKEADAAEALAKLNLGMTREVLHDITLTTETYFRKLLLAVYRRKLAEMMKKARIEIPADKGRSMMGTVDETGSLNYGEVFVQYSKDIDKPLIETEIFVGVVVVAKNPCFHPGDMRKFNAVDKPELKHMVDCIVFPAKGVRPHPNEMSGSDLDGDMYFVCWDESLIPANDNKVPMDYTPPIKQQLDRPVTEKDMVAYIGQYIKSDRLGVIANSHLVHADAQKDGIFSPQCLKLAQMHSDAVDFPKTGRLVLIPPELRPRSYPQFMEKHDKPVYKSSSILALLYDQCRVVASTLRSKPPAEVRVNRDFVITGYEQYVETAEQLKEFYGSHIRDLMNTYGVSSEEELITGHIFRFVQVRRGTLKREYEEVVGLIRSQIQSLRSATKSMFFEEFGGEKDGDEIEVRKKASALYVVAYVNSGSELELLSLPWIFSDLLLGIPKEKFDDDLNACNCQTVSSHSQLEELSSGIIRFAKSLSQISARVGSQQTRKTVFEQIFHAVEESKMPVTLVLFGSVVTGFDHADSSLDIFVKNRDGCSKDVILATISSLVEHFGKSQQAAELSLGENKATSLLVCDGDTNIKVNLYSSEECLKRTQFILGTLNRNKWMIPILMVILTWARETKFVGTNRESLLTTEQLIILFVNFAQRCQAHFVPADERENDVILSHLEQNNSVTCNICDCSQQLCSKVDCVFSNPLYTQRDISSVCNEPAEILLNFLYYYFVHRASELRSCCDLSSPDQLLVDLMDPQYQQLADIMLACYHLFACSESVNEFLYLPPGKDDHIVIDLSRQASSCVAFVEEHFELKLKTSCQADLVRIRRKPFRGALAGLIVEAWGSKKSLEAIEKKINELENMSLLFTISSVPLSPLNVSESYVTTFEGSWSKDEVINFELYKGPVQPHHDRSKRDNLTFVPRVLSVNTSAKHNMLKITENVMRQVSVMNKSYDEVIHGRVRAVISFGTYYIITPEAHPSNMTEGEFDRTMNRRLPTHTAGLVNPDQVIERGRGRGARPLGRGSTYSSYSRYGIDSGATSSPTMYRGMASRRPFIGQGQGMMRCPGIRGQPRQLIQFDSRSPNFQYRPRNRGHEYRYRGSGSPRYSGSASPELPSSPGSPINESPVADARQPGGWRHAFIPAANHNFVDHKLNAFLKQNGFVQTGVTKEYRITVKLKVRDYLSKIDGIIILDEDFRLRGLTLPDIKWLCANIVTNKAPGQQHPYDIRFKIHTRLAITSAEMTRRTEDCMDLIRNHKTLLRRDDRGVVVGVHPDYNDRIRFMRYKDVAKYELDENPQLPTSSRFLQGMKIRVNHGMECSRPGRDGMFKEVDKNRTEITVIPELPDLKNTEKLQAFMENMWTFARQFGEVLM